MQESFGGDSFGGVCNLHHAESEMGGGNIERMVGIAEASKQEAAVLAQNELQRKERLLHGLTSR